jgi:amino acid adenylation domain-containing protein
MSGQETLSAAKQALLQKWLRGQPSSTPAGGIEPRPAGEPPVLSAGQQRLWVLHQLAPRTPAYNLYQALRVEGPLNAVALEWSLGEVVRRHAVLRTVFETHEGRAVPVALPGFRLRLSQVDLRSAVEAEREILARRLASEEVARGFDLDAGPLIRTLLLRLSGADHVLVVTMHHIVADEWSLEVFWREVAALYEAFCASRPPALPEPPLQYADYAGWQRARAASPDGERQLAYWRAKLGGSLPMLRLPTDRPRPERQSFRGALESLTLPPGLAEALGRIGRREGATPFVMLLAAFKTLLHRSSGETDMLVGTPVTTRTRPELEGLIGFFLNTLVLRSDLAGDPTFVEVVGRVRGTVLEAFAHQETPFETLVDELGPERRLDHNPLFQVMFVLQREPAVSGFPAGLRLRPYRLDAGAAKFDLTLFATEAAQGLELTLEYSSDLFDRATVRRMLEQLGVMLEGIAQDPDRRISELPLLSAVERRLLTEWNGPRAPAPADACIHHGFESRTARDPDAAAIWYDGEPLTYGELNSRADALAHRLRGLGVGPEVCIGLCVERSPEMLTGILGILKAGGAYVPLDPAYPEAWLRFVLEDTRAPVVLTQQRLAGRLPKTGARVVCLDADTGTEVDGTRPGAGPTPENLAYVIYTSGSTGRPKGVLVTHRNLAHSTHARFNHYADAPERFLLLPSFAFDSSVAGIFWTLCAGGALVLPQPRAEQDVHGLGELIARQAVTHTLCLPSLYELVLEHVDPARLASLRTVIVAGEPCPPGLPRWHHERVPGASLFNEYGPTEATVWSTAFEVPPDFAAARVPIGRPVADTRAYVLDAHRQPLPIGVPGELYVGGPGIARGYLNRVEETAERFLPDPFGGEPGSRLYRTGDRVRWLPDGDLEFLGRVDLQLKIRGYRVEPGEIEAALNAYPGVRESVVTTRALAPARALPAADTPPGEDSLVSALLALDPDEAERLLCEAERLPATRPPLP